jgi:hypothetical protein
MREMIQRTVKAMDRICYLAKKMIPNENKRNEWFSTPNDEFKGFSPNQMVEQGHLLIVLGYLTSKCDEPVKIIKMKKNTVYDKKELAQLLDEMLPDKNDQKKWLAAKNDELDGCSPNQFIKKGAITMIIAFLQDIRDGAFK